MDFWLKKDWLNREPPYAFAWDHFLFIFISILIGVGLSFLLYKKDRKTIKIALIILWGIAVFSLATYFGLQYYLCITDPTNHPFNIESNLPLHSCFMFVYIFPFAIFSKNHIVKTAASSFVVVVNMIMGFITMFVGAPTPGYSAFSFMGLQSIGYHALIFIAPLVMVITNYYDLQKWDLKYGISLFGILALTIWVFDAITGCDYFYIYDGHCFGILYEISENVPHIVWTLITVSCYVITAFIIHFLIFYAKYFYARRKQGMVTEQ